MSAELAVVGLGRMPYGQALQLQRALAQARIDRSIPNDLLLLVEHPPVITLGRSFKADHLSTPTHVLETRGIELFEIERGGDATFHGPGQLVGYPIYDLSEHRKDLHWFLRQIEESLIQALTTLGVPAQRDSRYTGVWTRNRKIASIGIHVKQWVTWHGFALNVTTDLSYFDLIVPCGIPEVAMTSVSRELGEQTPRDVWARMLDSVVLGFAEVFDQQARATTMEELNLAV
ncbi:MAG: lipoyl(octanoyl) transferase LipB [Gemmatimonadales bacterium]|nr:lipoyl(octanoyl) transferase LipB [Gemmatimonadales bacterium]NIN13117.1 lipoyl(octanoyl) transferase LipB [Gemmatimonadales bacterium]NIN51201.1 lipoyl(octanoyl) transferase LipB [Gemmatimonadales bacterium]NIP08665.1 lipoyl(octanoyl) transferase LipB [Gemmatimonadales bacterium]NIR02353.1 lipoyl(octanoyl) transferase LipB [Gemmatimonadales bacterium]